ncbi:MAG TPA: hypothetical protein VMG40_01805 [Bryobacteraceae bacterium]|nr:hypothetical protein [Bryobacteraceae bacterium]
MATGHAVTGHEERDASVRTIVYTLMGLAVGAAICIMIVYGIFWYLAGHPLRTGPANPLALEQHQLPPAPRLEDHPTVELNDLHTYENQILDSYGWTDKAQNKVRIPIDKAMELQLQKGFPTQPAGKGK